LGRSRNNALGARTSKGIGGRNTARIEGAIKKAYHGSSANNLNYGGGGGGMSRNIFSQS